MAVGKKVGGCIYVHRSALCNSSIPFPIVFNAVSSIPKGWSFDVIKYNLKDGSVSFIQSPDWTSSDEPQAGDSYRVSSSGIVKFRKSNKDNPQIYHSKHLFVSPNYKGFSIEECRKRTEKWKSLNIDTTKIGYLNYWKEVVTDKIDGVSKTIANNNPDTTYFSTEEIKTANITARDSEAIGKNAIVPQIIKKFIDKSAKILDFGAGPNAPHTQMLRDDGFTDVTAYDFGANLNGRHDPLALTKQYDVVFASNVLNVQSSKSMMMGTLIQIRSVLSPGKKLYCNYPRSPRKNDLATDQVLTILSSMLGNVTVIYGSNSTTVFEVTMRSSGKRKRL